MKVLLDTNVFLRYVHKIDPLYPTVRAAVTAIWAAGHVPHLVPQNFYEFRVVATRPATGGGFGLTVPECVTLLGSVDTTFPILADAPSILATWRGLVARHD